MSIHESSTMTANVMVVTALTNASDGMIKPGITMPSLHAPRPGLLPSRFHGEALVLALLLCLVAGILIGRRFKAEF